MPPTTGSYSKNIRGGFDESNRLLLGLVQKSIPWVDADENRKEFLRYTWVRRALETVIGDASPNDGFKIVGDATANDFLIKGGDGTFDGAGRMWVRGIHAFLKGDIRFLNVGGTDDRNYCAPQITAISGVGNITLQDSAASYVPGSLVGRTLVPDVTGVPSSVILSNTATSITVGIDLVAAGAAVGDRYRVNMTTAGVGGRNDGVYLNVSIDEVDGDELPTIKHNLGTLMAAQLFIQIHHTIEVHQGDAVGLPGSLAASYTDADGFEHFRVKLADIARFNGQAAINAVDVTDRRATSANFSTFLKKIGDNMSGDLNMLAGADITLAVGNTVDGRDVSVDGAKLDTITWTAQGIADQLPKARQRVAGTTIVGMNAVTKNVSQFLRTKTPGGTTTVKGVITTLPDNDVVIVRAVDKDAIVDVNLNGVLGRLTQLHPFPNISGTWLFTNAAFSVSGTGGAALTELQVGDIVQGPDGLYYTVATIPGNNAFTIIEPFAGVTGTTASPAARRFTLTLRVNAEGSEIDFNPATDGIAPGAVDIDWFFHEVFDFANKPPFDPMDGVFGDQAPPEIPLATTALAGKVQLVTDGGTTAGRVPQANDTRLGRVKGRFGVTLSALKSEVELAQGSGITISMVESGDKVTFTISNAAPGGGASFPGFGSGTPAADSVSGSPGASGLASNSDHSHPLSAINSVKVGFNAFSAAASPTFAPGFTPRGVIAYAAVNDGPGSSIGASNGVGSGSSLQWSGTANLGSVSGGKILAGATSTWAVSAFNSGAVTLTRDAGAGTITGAMLVVGDSAP